MLAEGLSCEPPADDSPTAGRVSIWVLKRCSGWCTTMSAPASTAGISHSTRFIYHLPHRSTTHPPHLLWRPPQRPPVALSTTREPSRGAGGVRLWVSRFEATISGSTVSFMGLKPCPRRWVSSTQEIRDQELENVTLITHSLDHLLTTSAPLRVSLPSSVEHFGATKAFMCFLSLVQYAGDNCLICGHAAHTWGRVMAGDCPS